MKANDAEMGMKSFDVISRKRWFAVGAAVLVMTAALVSQTAPGTNQRANRISQEVTSGAMVAVAGTVHPLTRRATDLGAVNSEMQLDSMTLNIGLSAAQQTELDTLLAAQQNPKSPQYHQWLTQEEYGARFGLTDSDLSKVTGWLAAQGFTVKGVAPSRNLVTFSGTVSQVDSAFRTQIHQYKLADGTTHISNATDISIPKAFSGVVINVRGLSSFRPKPHAIKRAKPDFTSSASGNHFLAPGDWATIYGVNAIYNAGYTGTLMHVGVAGQTYIPEQDITNFRAAAGLSAPLLNMVCISSSSLCGAAAAPKNEDVDDVGEADLDVEWSGGIAKNATVDFIYAAADDQTLGVFDSLIYGITTYKVSSAVVPVIGVSYGDCEYDVQAGGSSYKTYLDGYLAEAGTQGQTVIISSGDDGAGCTVSTADQVATNGASVSWPATSPYVTAVGGTTFDGDGTVANPDTGADAYWSYSSSADIVSSALQYIPETSWNDTAYGESVEPSAWTLSSSTGGVSILYPLPSWQPAPNNYVGTSGRFVPDVAFTASPFHDGYLVCTENFPASETGTPTSNPGSTCVSGFRSSAGNGSLTEFGGTSASAQVFSGMVTLLVQAYGKQGNINPTLYGLAANATTYPEVFHDITSGNNDVPCSAGTGCVSGEVGYSATTGYDLVTGLGSINGGALYTALGTGLSATTTTVTAAPDSVAIGGTTTLTATTTSSATGTITGTMTFMRGTTTLGQVALSSGTATLANIAVTVANGFSAGTDPITADYGGNSTFAASSSSTGLTVNGLATTTAVTATPETSGTTTLTATVTPASATGTVTFSLGGTALGTATLLSGTATSNPITVSAANGFSTGTDTITARYSGDATYSTSSGATALAVTVMVAPSYTLSASPTTTAIAVGSSGVVTLTLTPTNYTGTIALNAICSTPSAISATFNPSSISMANGVQSPTLTITTSASAANHAPAVPWKSGGAVMFCAVLLGAPFTRRRKRTMTVLMMALAVVGGGFLMSCGGGSSSTPKAARTYYVTVTPTGTGTVTNATPIMITVTVQ
jgi:hypothetical protein